jgi:hypothetical protein
MAVVTPTPKAQFFYANGTPLVGGKVYTYSAGTTTPQVSYTDYTGLTPNENPVILDSRGEANIWLGELSYKFRLTDENDVEIWTVDYVTAPLTSVSPVLSGNVTISTDSIGPALKVTQIGTGNAIVVQDETDPDTTPFVVTNTGSVGIGTTVPATKLAVNGTISTDTIAEYTSAAGVTIDGVVVKDSAIAGDYLRIAAKTVQATTTGTSVTFNSIPNWVRRVTVMFNGVSTDNTSPLLVKLGTGGGIASTGYASTGARLAAAGTTVDSSTAGFLINSTSAADAVSGTLVISAVDPANYIYAADHTVKDGTTAVMTGAGNVTLGNLMTQLSITTVTGTSNFDAGSINVLYE